ncbi:hypothetical protein [Streptomyces sp. NPDC002685]|uniref:hypothetical protein n=1 Tax=Streptomyces sp. NPDC002685 TaxID=3154540 RepID=UPI00331DBA65
MTDRSVPDGTRVTVPNGVPLKGSSATIQIAFRPLTRTETTMIRSRAFASVLFTAAALLGVGVAPASAQSSAAAVSCYGGAKTLTYHYQEAAKEYGTFTTSSRCGDINMRLLSTDVPGAFLDACVVFVDHTTKCNHDNKYSTHGTPWATVATDVNDGTHFVLRVHAYDTDAQNVTFQLAY